VARGGVGQRVAAVEDVDVVLAGACRDASLVHVEARVGERVLPVADADADVVAVQRPDTELDKAVIDWSRTKWPLPWITFDDFRHPPNATQV
jgi:hypothetical protein